MERKIRGLSFVVPTMLLITLVPTVAGASANRVKATLTLSTTQVEVNTSVEATGCLSSLPRNSSVFLQQSFGKGKQWKSVYREKAPKPGCFKTSLHESSMAKAPIRIAIYQSGAVVGVSPVETVTVYGPIPIAIFLNDVVGIGDSTTVQTGGHTYAAVGFLMENSSQTAQTTSTCRSATLTMVQSTDDINNPGQGTATFELTQNSTNEQSVTFPDETVTTLAVTLDGSISTWIDDDTQSYDFGGPELYFLPGTTADCYTPTGT